MVQNCVISKTDIEQRLAFGWAYVSEDETGELVRDLQGDSIEITELEQAAYQHVLLFHAAGESHDPGRRCIGSLVESVVFTPDKKRAMGIADDSVPCGWWVGYHIDDDDAWDGIRSGEFAMFSIEGTADRVRDSEPACVARTLSEMFGIANGGAHGRAGLLKGPVHIG